MPCYDPHWLRQYYDDYGMKEWNRWDRSPVERVKFLVHLNYLKKHIRPSDRVLEMGAGAGRFTQELAKITSRIVVADISPGQLRLNEENSRSAGIADQVEAWVECDMCSLEAVFADEEFDAVVCYGGPLSYVFERNHDALAELQRVTKPGGLVLLSVMSLWGSVHQFLSGILQVPIEANRQIVNTGNLTPESIGPNGHYTHMFRADELQRLLASCGLEVLMLSASNCITTNWGESLATVAEDADTWQHLLELELEACQQPGCLDMGTHLIAVCRKQT